jgi:sulfonate transport system ATP-binding protein
LLITYDFEEAVAIADRIILLQEEIPQDVPILLPRPRQRDHAAFTSTINQILRKIIGQPDHTQHNIDEKLKYPLNSVRKIDL